VPRYFIEEPQKRLARSNRLKGKTIHEDGFTLAPYRSVDSFDTLTTSPFPGCNSLDELYERAVNLHRDADCLGVRELLSEEDEMQPNGKIFRKAVFGDYHWQSYREVNERVFNVGSGLRVLAIEALSSDAKSGEPLSSSTPLANVCIFAETRAEWIVSVFACFKSNLPVVTLYATLGEEAVMHAINETECSIVITCSELVNKCQDIMHLMPKVKHIVYFEGAKKPKVDKLTSNVKVQSLSSLEALGARPENRKAYEERRRPTRVGSCLTKQSQDLPEVSAGVKV
jgi:long-chain acyl-CoA synthetase